MSISYSFISHRVAALYNICVCAVLITMASCSGYDRSGGEPVTVNRLDQALLDDSIQPSSPLRHAADVLFAVSGYGQLTDSSLAAYRKNPSIRIHVRAMDSLWRDLHPLEKDLGRVKFNYLKLFPGMTFPSVCSVISPFNQSVFTADSLIFIGLNHYFGTDYPPYGYFPDYIRNRKIPARIIPDVAEAIVRGIYPYSPFDGYPTVLSRMLYEGAVAEAVMQLTGLSEQQVLGYDDEEMKWAVDNEQRVWQAIVERKMLFSTDQQLASSLVSLAPFTSAINPGAPGAAGRFIGHRIVSAYLDRKAVSMPELLSPAFYCGQSVLLDSQYN